MAWVKLDDAMPHHPKVMAAGAQAFALDVAAIAYSNRYLTDGFIGDDQLPAVLPCLTQPRKHAAKLATVGRWVRDDERGGWTIHDVHEYQPTAEQQREVSRKRAEAGRQGGSKSGASRRANSKQVASPGVEANANPGPVPGPVPETQGQNPLSADADVDESFDRFWQAYPRGKAGKPGGDGARKPTLDKWRRLKPEQREACLVGVEHYRQFVESLDGPIAAHALTWLNQERWEQWQEPAEPQGPGQLVNAAKFTEGGRF